MASDVKGFDIKKLGKGAYEFALRHDQAYAWRCIKDWCNDTNPLWTAINREAWKWMMMHDYGKSYERCFGTPEIGLGKGQSFVSTGR